MAFVSLLGAYAYSTLFDSVADGVGFVKNKYYNTTVYSTDGYKVARYHQKVKDVTPALMKGK